MGLSGIGENNNPEDDQSPQQKKKPKDIQPEHALFCPLPRPIFAQEAHRTHRGASTPGKKRLDFCWS